LHGYIQPFTGSEPVLVRYADCPPQAVWGIEIVRDVSRPKRTSLRFARIASNGGPLRLFRAPRPRSFPILTIGPDYNHPVKCVNAKCKHPCSTTHSFSK